MEDGIADVQPPNLTHGREGEEEEENSSGFLRNFISNMVSSEGGGEGKKEEGGGGGKPTGFLRNFISNMVYAEGGDEKKEEEEKHNGGIVTNLISNLVSPRSTTETVEGASASGVLGVDEDKDGGSESVEVKGGGGDGGKSIGNLISELFHHGEASEEKAEGVEEKVKTEEEEEEGGKGGRGGGIIDNIVSHLPASLQGDAVTTTDEAALLIHSIIHE